ncbi:MAG: T9SS type A sorting domain-containing protein [Bacteroidota bacterium]|nr:T9SS type A sorting domain-containing protein [Bacteroidota bacterium]
MKLIFVFYFVLLISTSLVGQGFSKIIDYDPTGQCRNLYVFPGHDYIFTIGDYIDSARVAIRPFWAKYDYNGKLLKFDTLNDYRDLGIFQFGNGENQYTEVNDSTIILSAGKYNPNASYLDNYILKINLNNGHIIESTYINTDTFGFVSCLSYDNLRNTIIAGTGSYEIKNKIEILEFNDKLNLIHRVIARIDSTQAFAPYYIRKVNGLYKVVGETSTRSKAISTIGYFTSEIDSIGNIQYFKKLKSSVPLSGWTLGNKRIYERQDGDFILGGSYLVNYLPTQRDENVFAHPVRVNSNFDSIRWELKMYYKPNYLYPYQFYNGLISINNEKEYIGYGDDLDTLSGSCVLYKFNEDGDSLWYKRIIPGDAKRDSLGWVPTYMAAESPGGGIVVVGCVYDQRRPDYMVIRSYIMYLDYDGCLIPDCNNIVSAKDIEEGNKKYFNVYPNPMSGQIQVLCNYEHEQKYNFTLLNIQSIKVWERIISCHQSDQIFWSIEDIPSGNYFLQIKDEHGKILQLEKLIKL